MHAREIKCENQILMDLDFFVITVMRINNYDVKMQRWGFEILKIMDFYIFMAFSYRESMLNTHFHFFVHKTVCKVAAPYNLDFTE